jgi:hypothetical protein
MFWAIVPPVAMLIFAFVQFYRRDLSERTASLNQAES